MNAAVATAAPPGLVSAGRRSTSVPARADGVELLGTLPNSGYRRPPALARRADGQLVKLTPLLYGLLESIDGVRSYDELAQELGRRAGRRADAADVRHLVERKLGPLGLLQGENGAAAPARKANPLLALRLRLVVSNPKLTNRLVAPFAWLFSPLVLIPALAAFAGVSWWLLAEKGLSSPLHQAFYDPAMILAVWGLILLSAGFHELGHGAACRYAGARPGAMGAGLYLVWPTFYTDVSDAYRLNRRDRLRVDLGGLYFNALFAVATVGLWALVGGDALLLVIAAQLLQMLRQLVPFVRADGYHILADLIGVPDLFAQIKPTLLGLLPTRWGRPEHRVLKPWARAVVAGWVLLVVPVLIALLTYAVLFLPRLAATAWDSMGHEWAGATGFWAERDVAGFAVKLISAGLVALPVLAICYLLLRIARQAGARIWAATSGRPALRSLAVLGAAALVALVSWAWWPRDQYRPIQADEPGPLPSITGETATPAVSLIPTVSANTPPPTGPPPVIQLSGGAAAEAPPTSPATQEDEDQGTLPPSADLPVEMAPESSSAWPFPFDPPPEPEPGDNQALAVNTEDGASVSDLVTSLLILSAGDEVEQTNAAYALASCTNCTTTAIAFQVILIVGYVEEIAAINEAVALNYQCSECMTAAFAYQIVATLMEPPGDELLAELESTLAQVDQLESALGSMTLDQLYLALEQLEADVLEALAGAQSLQSMGLALTNEQGSGGQSESDGAAVPTDSAPSAPSEEPTSSTQTEAQPEPDTTESAPEGESCETTQDETTSEPSGGVTQDSGEPTESSSCTNSSPPDETSSSSDDASPEDSSTAETAPAP